jgi:hypothetical protein
MMEITLGHRYLRHRVYHFYIPPEGTAAMAAETCIHNKDYPCRQCETTRAYEETVRRQAYTEQEARERFVEAERLRKLGIVLPDRASPKGKEQAGENGGGATGKGKGK